jgi:antitoxin VapB
MPLYIRDESVAELAREVKQATGAKTVTEAVRAALEHQLRSVPDNRTFEQKIAKAMAMADAMGPSDHSFDMKQFMDELSEE